jgi:hypothetical protein
MTSSPTDVSGTTTTLDGSLPVRTGARFVTLMAVLLNPFGSLQSVILRFLRKYRPLGFLRKLRHEVRENLLILDCCGVVAERTDFGPLRRLSPKGRPRSATPATGVFIPLQVIDYGSQSRGYGAPLQL